MRIGIALALLLAASHARAEECRATAVLEGDAALVDSIEGALQRRGVETRAIASCPATTARLDRRGAQIAVKVIDPAGRTSERIFVDTDAAAALIASWARQDMSSSLLLGFVVPDAPAPAVAETTARVDAPASRARRSRDRLTFAAAGESSVDFTDGKQWLGARATACVRLGPTCLGGVARYLSADDRSSVDILGAATLPIALTPRAALVLGAAAGAGWFEADYSRAEAMLTSKTTGLRLDGHVSFAYLLGHHVSLHFGISVGASPSAPVTVIADGDTPVTNHEPRGFFRGDAGLRIGVP
jgi:hypothetical protein